MPEYQVLARKYRPKHFADVIGQDPIVTTLKNAIKMGKVAHAYLFCGSRGTGKTTLARLFAKALNCPHPSADFEPCATCSTCLEIAGGHALDVLEIDGASHRGIEDVRQINETIGYAPTSGNYKIYLIDEVHMLTKEAFNALLKTLEEPPPAVKFFFATTEPHKIPPTILSRCQRFSLNRIPPELIEQKLAHIAADLDLSVQPEVLRTLAQLAEGSLRDAESLFDQVLAFREGPLTTETLSEALGIVPRSLLFTFDQAGIQGDLSAAFTLAETIFSSGKNLSYFLEELLAHYRTLLLLKMSDTSPLLTPQEKEAYAQILPHYTHHQCLQILDLLIDATGTLKTAPSPRFALEMLLLRILRVRQRLPLETLVQRLSALEARLEKQQPPKEEEQPPSTHPSHLETVMHFAAKEENPPSLPKKEEQPPSTHPSHPETVMHFAAKELGGSLKK